MNFSDALNIIKKDKDYGMRLPEYNIVFDTLFYVDPMTLNSKTLLPLIKDLYYSISAFYAPKLRGVPPKEAFEYTDGETQKFFSSLATIIVHDLLPFRPASSFLCTKGHTLWYPKLEEIMRSDWQVVPRTSCTVDTEK